MKPKEKAEELVKRYTEIDVDSVDTIEGIIKIYIDNDKAKQCALISVEEILGQFRWKPSTGSSYWEEVKSELAKLELLNLNK